ncbi:uncharacterized protein ACA1_223200 [Acanthamoeba castellanii str. Neff]|uniref:Uncharacterized protein n=1 Tax=Acanthamoeba castellanii (strain ATCC 30010 / Neff) TaxID=1257118 RepID=L8GS68_ACACF|nr:uncharacterized protein ACA1_223200 [Acanthamoeba castellanii str. Neff]ELR16024.1 hypothetical protein ACA1_223200 [Acanthamoeba castellanii str. Neff]
MTGTTTGQHNATAALDWWQAEASKHERPWHEQRNGERLGREEGARVKRQQVAALVRFRAATSRLRRPAEREA